MTLIEEIPKIGKSVRLTLGNGKKLDGVLTQVIFDLVSSYIVIQKNERFREISYGYVKSIDIYP